MTGHADLLSKVGDDLGPVVLKSIPPNDLGTAVDDALRLKASH
jgi:hypothetical protein